MNDFDPTKQYRCTIIRGKAKSDLDNLLSKYANIIDEICPCSKDEFPSLFNNKLKESIGGTKKTLDNHRTEIAYKLFGMFFFDKEDVVYPSERTLIFLENQDQPQFFKDICLKFQFPNGMDSVHTLEERLDKNISLRQFPFILELLNIADEHNHNLTKNEIGYFVLNSLEVLQGKISPLDVYKKVIEYRERNAEVRVYEDAKASSYSMQHITEQLNLLELANLIRISDGKIFINKIEQSAITYIKSFWNSGLPFEIKRYDFSLLEDRKNLYKDWQIYYSQVDKEGIDIFKTSVEALQFTIEKAPIVSSKAVFTESKIKLGDDGEYFVYEYEQERVGKFDRRLTNKVLLLGKTKGLGYDIQSIFADGSERSEFVKYIEVKSTKRVTLPEEGQDGWLDSLTITRNEWVAAEQHSKSYALYRVYFTPKKTIVYVIGNPYNKNIEGKLKCTPTNYRLDFSNYSIDNIFER